MTQDIGPAIDKLEDAVRDFLSNTSNPGVSISVTDSKKTVHLSASGVSDIKTKAPVTPDTLFEIGSISKSFASVCIMQLVEKNKLDLDEPVRTYLPWLKVSSKYAPFTLHHLMTHTSGIVTGSESTLAGPPGVLALEGSETGSPPGEFFHYSNVGYKIVGMVLEQVLAKPIGAILKERVLDPLEMTSSLPTITNDVRNNLAVGYGPYFDDRPAPLMCPLAEAVWLESDTADGSICTTAKDMAKYVRMFLNKGRGPRGRIISEDSFERMAKGHVSQGEHYPGEFYGYGLGVSEHDGNRWIGHTGGMVGFVSSMRMDFDDGLGIVVLLNSLHDADKVAKYGLSVLSASVKGKELPPAPSKTRQVEVDSASECVGKYVQGSRGFDVIAEGGRLTMRYGSRPIDLEPRERGLFFVDHQDFQYYLLGFEKKDGHAVAAFHGPDVFVKVGSPSKKAYTHPGNWSGYTGHFRSYNPWFSNFRVVLRSGSLVFIPAFNGVEEPMMEIDGGRFRIGTDDRSPETIEFDQNLGGKAHRAKLSCGDYYYRVPTP